MSREIKFRVWDFASQSMKSSKRWAVGFDGTVWPSDGKGGYQAWEKDKGFALMQFTGLRDKNGVEIYEGDIVKHRFEDYEDFTKYVVEWKPNECQFRGEEIGGGRHNLSIYSSMEVCGNIYENKDLLV